MSEDFRGEDSTDEVGRRGTRLTGHKTRSAFDRYDIVSESDLKAGVDRLAAYVKKLPN